MSTITSIDLAFPAQWSKDHLAHAQKQFNRDPSAVHWNVCVRAMLTYQQMQFALRSSTVNKDKLFHELSESPIGDWQDLICMNTLGLSCADAVNRL